MTDPAPTRYLWNRVTHKMDVMNDYQFECYFEGYLDEMVALYSAVEEINSSISFHQRKINDLTDEKAKLWR